MRMKAVTLVALIQIAIAGGHSAHAATPTPSAKESPSAKGEPAVSATPARAMRTPRPTPTCKPGTHAVGPEDPNCSAFGECCKPDGAQKAN
jgi:hypothetical protein